MMDSSQLSVPVNPTFAFGLWMAKPSQAQTPTKRAPSSTAENSSDTLHLYTIFHFQTQPRDPLKGSLVMKADKMQPSMGDQNYCYHAQQMDKFGSGPWNLGPAYAYTNHTMGLSIGHYGALTDIIS